MTRDAHYGPGDKDSLGEPASGPHRRALAWLSRWRIRRDLDDARVAIVNLAARIDSLEDHQVVVAGDIVDRVRAAREATDADDR